MFDELHMVLDGHRGYQIEYILSKLKALERIEQDRIDNGLTPKGDPISNEALRNNKHEDFKAKQFQIIGMSATMGGRPNLEKWLDCQVHSYNFRPVELNEYYSRDNLVFDKKGQQVLTLPQTLKLTNEKLLLFTKTYFEFRKSVILFCHTKKQ